MSKTTDKTYKPIITLNYQKTTDKRDTPSKTRLDNQQPVYCFFSAGAAAFLAVFLGAAAFFGAAAFLAVVFLGAAAFFGAAAFLVVVFLVVALAFAVVGFFAVVFFLVVVFFLAGVAFLAFLAAAALGFFPFFLIASLAAGESL